MRFYAETQESSSNYAPVGVVSICETRIILACSLDPSQQLVSRRIPTYNSMVM